MKNIYKAGLITILMINVFLTSSASAQTVECGKRNPARCFSDHVSLAFLQCSLVINRWQIGAQFDFPKTRTLPDRSEPLGCLADKSRALESQYKEARDYLASNKDGLAALKDAYSYWLTSSDLLSDSLAVNPTTANLKADREKRDAREFSLKEKLNRLNLEI